MYRSSLGLTGGVLADFAVAADKLPPIPVPPGEMKNSLHGIDAFIPSFDPNHQILRML
jgi:hypothetical protein